MDNEDKKIWKTRLAASLDGHTKHSRDCHLSGEYLASEAWPIVEAAIDTECARAVEIARCLDNDHIADAIEMGAKAAPVVPMKLPLRSSQA